MAVRSRRGRCRPGCARLRPQPSGHRRRHPGRSLAPSDRRPHPESAEGAVPPELAARFVTASLGGAALFWAILGSACGWLMSGLVRESESRPALRVQPGAR
ncbi:CbtA family protein [Azospirillum sp. B2RO_4]